MCAVCERPHVADQRGGGSNRGLPGVPPGRECQAWTSIAFVAVLAAFTVVQVLLALGDPARPLDYSRFLRLVEQ